MRELVLQAAADRHEEGDQNDDDAEPAQEDAPRMRRASSVPARKRAGGETFVGREPIRRVAPVPAVAAGSSVVLGHRSAPSWLRFSNLRPAEAPELIATAIG